MVGEVIKDNEEQSDDTNPWIEMAKEVPTFDALQNATAHRKLNRPHIPREVVEHITANYELLRGNVFDINIGDTRVSFTSLENFDPVVMSKSEPAPLSPLLKRLIESNNRADRHSTLIRSYESEDGMDRTMKFIEMATQNDPELQAFCKEYKIKDIHDLSPRQAIELTTKIVNMYTKYSYDEKGKPDGSRADKMTALQILQDGQRIRAQERMSPRSWDTWRGNGVCRNFAATTKFVFDTLKANQIEHNRLCDTYCIDRGSAETADYAPRNATQELDDSEESGHAWNDFIQVTNDGKTANLTSVDVTWAEYDLETKRPINLEHTSERTRIALQSVVDMIPYDEAGDAEAIKLLNYYGSQIDDVFDSHKKIPYANYAHDVMRIMHARFNLEKYYKSCYKTINYATDVFKNNRSGYFSINELETLYRIHGKNEQLVNTLIQNYVKIEYEKTSGDAKHPKSIFPDLQAKIDDYVNASK
ncbi:hypothetical protein IKF12_01550 [Candidatus Saccharibacteria bacterium]|nr:hypothetical protein [Candidatus Saccharibacteria bacterium]